ncbi:type 4a pilus biogenesis protein PilO [Paraliobacillus sp. JSM ZJ581]|uniref:type 4a pilus biogenesis protein PilO n=1 Tax=Paraliobacillus sp. JSM ZJ581 TaxID=3342118 RepID=UPI0035A945FE
MIIEWNRRYSVALIFIVLMLILGGIFGFYKYVYPAQTEVKQLEEEIASQEKLINEVKDNQQAISEATVRNEQLERQLPKTILIDQLLVELEDIESASDIAISKIVASEASDLPESYPALNSPNYSIAFSSDNYDDMYTFLDELTHAERILEINQLEYEQNSENGMNAVVNITAFSSKS